MHWHRVRLQEIATVLACAGGLGACSHQAWLAPPEITQVPLRNLKESRIAVVLDSPRIKDQYQVSTGGHDFAFEGLRSYFKQTFVRTFKGLTKETHFGREPGYDAYVYPELELSMAGQLSKSCFAKLKLTIVDRAGRPVSESAFTGEGTFVNMSDGADACAIALRLAITEVWRTALPPLDALGGRS
jgi:hypothetical protein